MAKKPEEKINLFAASVPDLPGELPPRTSHTLPPKLDSKFYGLVYKAKDDSVVQQDQWVVFLAKDDAFAAVLPLYRAECVRLGADARHLASLDKMIAGVMAWRTANPSRCKTPDIKPGEKLLR